MPHAHEGSRFVTIFCREVQGVKAMDWRLIGIFFAGFVCGWFAYMLKWIWGFGKALKTSPVCPSCLGKWDELRKERNLLP